MLRTEELSDCNGSGWLSFRLSVRGVVTNVVSVPIVPPPQTAPVIQRLDPPRLALSQADNFIRVHLSGLEPGPLRAHFGGSSGGIANCCVASDFSSVDIKLPADLRKPGTYQLFFLNQIGTSDPANLSVVGPPSITTLDPSSIDLARPAAAAVSSTGPATRPTLSIAVPAAASIAQREPPNKAMITLDPDAAFTFKVHASDLEEPTALTLDGHPLPLRAKRFSGPDRWVSAALPAEYRSVRGYHKYEIRVETWSGRSEPAYLEIYNDPTAVHSVLPLLIPPPSSPSPLRSPLALPLPR